MVHQSTKCLSNGHRPETVKERRRFHGMKSRLSRKLSLTNGHRPVKVRLGQPSLLQQLPEKRLKKKPEIGEYGNSIWSTICDLEVRTRGLSVILAGWWTVVVIIYQGIQDIHQRPPRHLRLHRSPRLLLHLRLYLHQQTARCQLQLYKKTNRPRQIGKCHISQLRSRGSRLLVQVG